MNLELDDVQRELVAVTTEACEKFAPVWRVGTGEHHVGVKALGDIGVLGVRHPEPHGSGLGPVEAVLAAFACGSALAPTSLLVWPDLLGSVASDALAGSSTITGSFDPSRGVSFGGQTDETVIIDSTGAYLVGSDELTWQPVPNVDPTSSRGVPCQNAIPSSGVVVANSDEVDCWRWQFGVLVSAHLVGVGLGALGASVAYAKERHQFGRPIGSFQAVKHMLADSYTELEMARCQVLTAALCWAEDNAAAADQAIAASVVAASAAIRAGQTAIQVYGGIGFTAEAVPHLYYKRALQLQDDLLVAGVHGGLLLHRNLSLYG